MPLPILLDTNLLVLFVVGLTDPSYIPKHKRLAVYDQRDFEIVSEIVAGSDKLIICPNVASETSNLLRQIGEPARSRIGHVFAEIIARIEESYVPSVDAASLPEHLRLGITDSVLLLLAETNATLLTADLDLYLAAEDRNLSTINYNHVRAIRPDYN